LWSAHLKQTSRFWHWQMRSKPVIIKAMKQNTPQKHVAIIDPAVESPANHCFNQIASLTNGSLRYYLPAFSKSDTSISFDGLCGVVLLGSFANVDQNREWQAPLIKTVERLIEQNIPLLGICYGHQLIAHMYGARVEQPEFVKEKIVGLKKVDWLRKPKWIDHSEADSFWMAASHYQQVLDVPGGFDVAAQREDCQIESLAHKTKPIWTTQCHPEASLKFAKSREITEGLERLECGWSLVRGFLKNCLG